MKLTVYDVALLNLLKDLGPDIGVAFLVCRDSGRLEVDDLGEAARLWLSHDEIFSIKYLEFEQNVRENQVAFHAPLALASTRTRSALTREAWHISTWRLEQIQSQYCRSTDTTSSTY